MAKTNTKTQREYFLEIAELLSDNADIVEFCNSRIEKLNHKSKNDTRDAENLELAGRIEAILSEHEEGLRVTDIMNLDTDLKMNYSNQRITAVLKTMNVERVTEKGNSLYRLLG